MNLKTESPGLTSILLSKKTLETSNKNHVSRRKRIGKPAEVKKQTSQVAWVRPQQVFFLTCEVWTQFVAKKKKGYHNDEKIKQSQPVAH